MQNYNVKYSENFSIPIVYLSDSPSLMVTLDLFKPTVVLSGNSNSTEYYADTIGKRQYNMVLQQVKMANKYVYLKVLTGRDIKETGGYTGVFFVQRQDENKTTIFEEQINISVEEKELDKIINGMSIEQMIANTYSYSLLKSGKVPYKCLGAIPQKLIFRTGENKSLPSSAVYTVLKKDFDGNLAVYKDALKIPLLQTDGEGYGLTPDGNDKWDVSEDETESSYCILALPKGEYKVFAEYLVNGKKHTTDYSTLIFK